MFFVGLKYGDQAWNKKQKIYLKISIRYFNVKKNTFFTFWRILPGLEGRSSVNSKYANIPH